MPLSGAVRSSLRMAADSLKRFTSSLDSAAHAVDAISKAPQHTKYLFVIVPPSTTPDVLCGRVRASDVPRTADETRPAESAPPLQFSTRNRAEQAMAVPKCAKKLGAIGLSSCTIDVHTIHNTVIKHHAMEGTGGSRCRRWGQQENPGFARG